MKSHVLCSILFWMLGLVTLTAQTPWLPNPANSTVDIHRTGSIGIGAQPQARLHIETPCAYPDHQSSDCFQSEGVDIRMKRSFQLMDGSSQTAWRVWDIYNAGTRMGFSFTENASGSGSPKMTLSSGGFLDVSGAVAARGGALFVGQQGQEHFRVNYDGRLSVGQTGTEHLIVAPNGRVSIGTSDTPETLGTDDISAYRLYVHGGILSQEVRVRTLWSDYVFEPDYVLLSLPEVEAHIAEHGHLHDTPSGAEIEANGLELGSMMANQQAKIEELYLHLIEMNQRVEALEAENARLRKKRSKRQRS
jgi:hypothetical protein